MTSWIPPASEINHGRKSSSEEIISPFAVEENYYGPKTDPSKLTKDSKFGRTRTLSATQARFRSPFFPFTFFDANKQHSASNNPPAGQSNSSAIFDIDTSGESSDDSEDGLKDISSSALSPNASTSSLSQLKETKRVNDAIKSNSTESVSAPIRPIATSGTGHEGLSRPPTTVSYTNSQNSSLRRRGSGDEASSKNSKRFFISDIDSTLEELLANEDTNGDCQITIDDKGPKVLKLGTVNSNGFKRYDIRGTYMLSNLLQELTIAKRIGRKQMILDESRLSENPVDRMTRLITKSFWKNLTRQMNESSVLEMAKDTKIDTPEAKFPRIYVPSDDEEQFDYYSKIAAKYPDYKLQVEKVPTNITAEYIKSINHKPGLLALAVRHVSDNYADLEGYPYLVPGGRFNEQYGWDSYFMELGLLESGIIEPCVGMCENFIYEIEHYNKILNANRSYYLGRSQPPFLTDMAIKVFNYMKDKQGKTDLDFLKRSTAAAIKEYWTVWVCEPRLDPITGLSCYHADGLGIPPETEASHFHSVLQLFCKKYNLSFEEFTKKYNDGEIHEAGLDEYFLHDRAVRESGHDTTYRFEGVCAYLATIDLNSLLYRYEKDIAYLIKTYFDDEFENGDNSEKWEKLAEQRKSSIEKYLWNEQKGMYFDYNILTQSQSNYESVTTFYPLWAKLCDNSTANTLVKNAIPKFEVFGGLVSGTLESRGELGLELPSRQWDYPFAWAPHQILAWEGLKNYGFESEARRLSYRWCYLMTLAFVDFNGIVVEKYDATSENQPHKVEAEYGNQGAGFKGVATEGFGWVNASYLLGLKNLDQKGTRALGLVTSPTDFFSKLSKGDAGGYGIK